MMFGVKTWDLMTIVGATLLMITVGNCCLSAGTRRISN